MSGKALNPEQNDRIREAIRVLLKAYNNSQSRLAPAIGVKQATLSRLLGGQQGTSIHVAAKVARLAGRDLMELLQPEGGSAPASSSNPIVAAYPSLGPVLEAARLLGCTNEDVSTVLSEHDEAWGDLGDAYWMGEFLRTRDRRRRREQGLAPSSHPNPKSTIRGRH